MIYSVKILGPEGEEVSLQITSTETRESVLLKFMVSLAPSMPHERAERVRERAEILTAKFFAAISETPVTDTTNP